MSREMIGEHGGQSLRNQDKVGDLRALPLELPHYIDSCSQPEEQR